MTVYHLVLEILKIVLVAVYVVWPLVVIHLVVSQSSVADPFAPPG